MSTERDEEIVKLYRSGLDVRKIGTEVGLHYTTVSRILRRLGEKTRPSGRPNKAKPRPTRVPFPDGVSPGGSLADGVCIYCRTRFDDGARLLDHLAEEHGVPRAKPAERALRCRCGRELPRTNYAPCECESESGVA